MTHHVKKMTHVNEICIQDKHTRTTFASRFNASSYRPTYTSHPPNSSDRNSDAGGGGEGRGSSRIVAEGRAQRGPPAGGQKFAHSTGVLVRRINTGSVNVPVWWCPYRAATPPRRQRIGCLSRGTARHSRRRPWLWQFRSQSRSAAADTCTPLMSVLRMLHRTIVICWV